MKVDYQIKDPLPLTVSCTLDRLTVLIGPSGSGKTTLLRALAGLIPAQGEPWGGLPPQRRPVGYLPQGASVFPHLKVWQNVTYALRRRRSERRKRASELLAEMGLEGLANHVGGTLSGGQARRVALARALVRSPELLLLDEPTVGLDPASRAQVLRLLFRMAPTSGPSMLVATHDYRLALRANRVLVLEAGKIVQAGSPEEIYLHPVTRGAAQALGLSNLLSVTIREKAENQGRLSAVVDADHGFVLRAPWPDWAHVGDRAFLLVHPEHVRLRSTGQPAAHEGIEAEVQSLSRDGGGWRVACQAGSLSLGVFQPRLPEESPPEPGTRVILDFAYTELHLVPAA